MIDVTALQAVKVSNAVKVSVGLELLGRHGLQKVALKQSNDRFPWRPRPLGCRSTRQASVPRAIKRVSIRGGAERDRESSAVHLEKDNVLKPCKMAQVLVAFEHAVNRCHAQRERVRPHLRSLSTPRHRPSGQDATAGARCQSRRVVPYPALR